VADVAGVREMLDDAIDLFGVRFNPDNAHCAVTRCVCHPLAAAVSNNRSAAIVNRRPYEASVQVGTRATLPWSDPGPPCRTDGAPMMWDQGSTGQ
jgi:hypothetical protein